MAVQGTATVIIGTQASPRKRRGDSNTSYIQQNMFQRARNVHIAGGTFAAPAQGDVVIYGHPMATGGQAGSRGRLLPIFQIWAHTYLKCIK